MMNPLAANPEWQHIALYAILAAAVIVVLQRLPYVGRIFRFVFSFAILAFALFLLFQEVPYQPSLARLSETLGLDNQEVTGNELRVRMSPDGHFWVNGFVNGVPTRMLIDSGATITAISTHTAHTAGVGTGAGLVPVMLHTANGVAPAGTGTIKELRVGNIVARNLKVVSAPGLGDMDVIGMNFLSKLDSWSVQDHTLILVPHHPQTASKG